MNDLSNGPRLALNSFLPYRLNVLASFVSEALARVYGERYGIGIPEWRILATLGDIEATTATDVARQTHMHKTKVSRAVSELDRLGLLRREANALDHREAFLSLTPEGKRVYGEIVPLAKHFSEQLTMHLSDDEMATLGRAIDTLKSRALQLLNNHDWARR